MKKLVSNNRLTAKVYARACELGGAQPTTFKVLVTDDNGDQSLWSGKALITEKPTDKDGVSSLIAQAAKISTGEKEIDEVDGDWLQTQKVVTGESASKTYREIHGLDKVKTPRGKSADADLKNGVGVKS